MHGMIFSSLKSFVEECYGEQIWSDAVLRAGLQDRIYMPTVVFPDHELFAIIQQLAILTRLSLPKFLEAFGKHHFTFYINTFVLCPGKLKDIIDFIEHVDDIVHKSILIRNPEIQLPKFSMKRMNQTQIKIHYFSERKLCHFLKGLLKGAEQYFNQKILISEEKCMYEGGNECVFLVSKIDAPVLASKSNSSEKSMFVN